jgi:predicted NBD/HSP70 family sugar kinase
VRAGIERGDDAAISAARVAGRYLGRAVAGLVAALDVHEVVVHGPVAALGDPWLEAIRDEARRRSLPLLADRVDVRPARIAQDEVVLGASALLMTRELGLSLVR